MFDLVGVRVKLRGQVHYLKKKKERENISTTYV